MDIVALKCCFLLIVTAKLVTCQHNVIENICRSCEDVVSEYCCRYQGRCCEYVNPSGCPSPASPEARMNCISPLTCNSNKDCPMFKQCCDTFVCGAICMNSTAFPGYVY